MEDILDQLAEVLTKAREVAPEVYAIYVRQILVTGYAALALALLNALAAIACIWYGARRWKDDTVSESTATAWCIALSLCSLSVLLGLACALPRLVNPQYYAIQTLLGR